MKLQNFNSVYSLANTLYGTTLNPNNFEDIVLNGWELIGNKHTRLYRYKTNTVDRKIELPCNIDIIESVHIPWEDAQMTSNITIFPNVANEYYEQYSEAWKWDTNPLYHKGKLLNYKVEGDALLFDRNYDNVVIVYHGIIVDDTGLPLLNDKEVKALATYAAYIDLYKQSLVRKDGNMMQLASVVKLDWLKLCRSARIPDNLSQNEMDAILDVRTRWDRKLYNKSFKPTA